MQNGDGYGIVKIVLSHKQAKTIGHEAIEIALLTNANQLITVIAAKLKEYLNIVNH